MGLSSDLISQFVKVTNDKTRETSESSQYGTIVEYDGSKYIRLDGSELLTPINTTVSIKDGDRAIVSIKNHTATVTGNISDPAASSGTVIEMGSQITEFEIIVADKISTKELEAERARIDELIADNVTIKDTLTANRAEIDSLIAEDVTINGKLTANEAEIDKLYATKLDAEIADIKYATIENLDATNIKVNNLEATYGDFKDLTTDKFTAIEADITELHAGKLDASVADITYATIESLDAVKADINNLNADVADINTLIFGSASGEVIQTEFSNAVVAQIGDAQIKSAMIESLSASKITAGSIVTNNVHVTSDDGKLLIADETIQISDENEKVRVQIGKDASNDYSINVWDANGNLMFSKGGITSDAIKDAIIRDDMVSDTANISASKINIDSLFEEINGSTKTINSSNICIDADNQTLDVAFKSMSSEVDSLDESVTSQGTQLSIIQGKIDSKVWQEDIDAATNTMSTQYSELSQELDGISATVATHTTDISNVEDRVSNVEIDLSGFKSTVSSTYATKTELTNAETNITKIEERVSNAETSITQNAEQIELRATKVELETAISELEIGGRNLVQGTSSELQEVTLNQYFVIIASIPMSTLTDVYGLKDGDSVTLSMYLKSGSEKSICARIQHYTDNSNRTSKYGNNITTGNEGWSKVTCTLDTSYSKIDICINNSTIDITADTTEYYKCVKFEKGNKPTDWTQAPEDVDSKIDETANDIHEVISEQYSTITSDYKSVIASVLESYTSIDDFESYKETVSSELALLADQLSLKFTETTEQLNEVNGELQSQLNTITAYFTFDVDGMVIGKVENPNKVSIANDIIRISSHDETVQEFDASGNALTPRLRVTKTFELLGYLIDIDKRGNVNCAQHDKLVLYYGRNLLQNSNFLYEVDNTATSTAESQVHVYDTHLSLMSGSTLTLSYQVHSIGTRDTSLSTNTDLNNRFGMHGAAKWEDSTGTNTTAVYTYPFPQKLVASVNNDRVYMTAVMEPPAGYDVLTEFRITVQRYAKPAADNNETWLLGYPKLEFGDEPTDWVTAPEED